MSEIKDTKEKLRLCITAVFMEIHNWFWNPWCPDIVTNVIEWFI